MKIKSILVFLVCVFIIVQLASTADYSRVIPASQKQKNHIKYGLIKGFSITNVYAVKSKDFRNVYFVAGNIKGASNAVGVWSISGTPQSPGMTFSVNNVASKFSDYPLGSRTKAGITMADDGARLVESFVKSKFYKK